MKTWQKLKENPSLFRRYFIKEYLIKSCRSFFDNRNYHELESPIITNALPQERYLNVLSTDIKLKNGKVTKGYLTPTTETYNKKVLAAGLGEHYVITKVLRGLEDISVNHSPEFTMLEWYHLNANYLDLMDDCEQLVKFCVENINSLIQKEIKLNRFPLTQSSILDLNKITYANLNIDFSEPWLRLSIPELLKKYASIHLEEIQTEESFKKILKEKGYKVEESDDWQRMYEWVWESEIEQNLPKDRPLFVYDFPKQVCVLTQVNPNNPITCERIEVYIAGKEIGNGYTELLDWKYQEEKFLEEQKARTLLGLDPIAFDSDLIDALKSGLPKVTGIGLGLDRFAMILADANNISDINYFPVSEW